MIYGEFRVCTYDACYYCFECHENEEHVIPARVIHNWDLRKHQVAKHCKLFLLHIEEEPLFNIGGFFFFSKYGVAVFRVQVCGNFKFYDAVSGEKIAVTR